MSLRGILLSVMNYFDALRMDKKQVSTCGIWTTLLTVQAYYKGLRVGGGADS